MSTFLYPDPSVENLITIIRRLRPSERRQLFEQMQKEIGVEEITPPLPPTLADEPWAQQVDAATRRFLALCGSWEDERSANEIVADIVGARTVSTREVEHRGDKDGSDKRSKWLNDS